MRTLAQSLKQTATVGTRIPLPWPALDRTLELATKELNLVPGAPGAGKSVFALNLAMSQTTPVLYLALDDASSVLARLSALELGVEIRWAIDQMRDPDLKERMIGEVGDPHPNLFIEDGALTIEGIESRLEALTEVLGTAPPLVILDNLIDLIVPGYSYTDMGFYSTCLPELKAMAKRHNVCILALHHVTRRGGESQNPHGLGTRALKMTDLLYSGEREAAHVIGVYHSVQKDRMFVQILKQRDGDADPEGGLQIPLLWHPKLGSLGRA